MDFTYHLHELTCKLKMKESISGADHAEMNVVPKFPRHLDAEREKVRQIVERKREKISRKKAIFRDL